MYVFFFSSRRRHTSLQGDWSSDVCSSDLRAGRAMVTTFSLVYALFARLPARAVRKPVLSTLGMLFYLSTQLNLTKAPAAPISGPLRDGLRQGFRDDVEQLAAVLDRDLSSWL